MQDHIAPSGFVKIPDVSYLVKPNQLVQNRFRLSDTVASVFSGKDKVFGTLQVSTKA